MYDCYANGYYQFCKSNDLENFTFVQNTLTKGDFTPRHGSVMQITSAERKRLEAWSDLKLAIRAVNSIPAPTLTLEQLNKRDQLQEQAKQILDSSADTKKMKKITSKINKLKKSK